MTYDYDRYKADQEREREERFIANSPKTLHIIRKELVRISKGRAATTTPDPYRMLLNEVIKLIEKERFSALLHYHNDLLTYDLGRLMDRPPAFVWVVGESGTHMVLPSPTDIGWLEALLKQRVGDEYRWYFYSQHAGLNPYTPTIASEKLRDELLNQRELGEQRWRRSPLPSKTEIVVKERHGTRTSSKVLIIAPQLTHIGCQCQTCAKAGCKHYFWAYKCIVPTLKREKPERIERDFLYTFIPEHDIVSRDVEDENGKTITTYEYVPGKFDQERKHQ